MTTQAVAAKIAFGGVVPVLRVRDVSASLDHYTKTLGFSVSFRYPDFASISRGQVGLIGCAVIPPFSSEKYWTSTIFSIGTISR